MSLHAKSAMLVAVMMLCLAALSVHAKPAAGNPKRGKVLYTNICGGCHSLDANRVGPKHRGVFGRKAGSVPDYDYSPALKASHVVWNAETLDKWLSGPEKFIPGQKMNIEIDSPRDRTDIIAYLKSVS